MSINFLKHLRGTEYMLNMKTMKHENYSIPMMSANGFIDYKIRHRKSVMFSPAPRQSFDITFAHLILNP